MRATFEELSAQEERLFLELMSELEVALLGMGGEAGEAQTAEMGNELRAVVSRYAACFKQHHRRITAPVDELLSSLILEGDEQILRSGGDRAGDTPRLPDSLGGAAEVLEWTCRSAEE